MKSQKGNTSSTRNTAQAIEALKQKEQVWNQESAC